MALVDIDDELKEKVAEWVKKDSVEFPSMKNFVDKAIKRQIERLEAQVEKAQQKAQDARDIL